ncbi:MAG TPA: hypothetical protein VHL59_01335 [Thermoanaerobaculia bacterium]|nr:hypothetical protein [Thermoanaerobaculia bacterium]
MQLSIVTLGHVHTEDLTALTPHFDGLEQLVLDVPPRNALTDHRAELNRAVDAASADWILVVRERETIDDALAKEIAGAANAANAWGFRIRSVPFYAGKPLRIGRDDGELRLFHRRHFIRRGELAVQGTVIRLGSSFHSVTFASPEEHRDYLARQATPRSAIRRALLFVRYVLGSGARDANTLRYLWIEAGFDMSR